MANDEKKEKESILGETIKKVFSAGVTAAFLTEEGLRQYLQDLKLPKEIFGLVLQGASRSKDEITQRVSKEVIRLLSKIDWAKEAAKFAETHKFKFSIEVEIEKRDSK